MNLSRAAKKFRTLEPKQSADRKPVTSKKNPRQQEAVKPVATPEPVAETVQAPPPVVQTVTEPVAPAAPVAPEPALPPKRARVKSKRPRFVREKAEKRERVALPPLPPPSTKFTARVMTRNLALPPKDDATPLGR